MALVTGAALMALMPLVIGGCGTTNNPVQRARSSFESAKTGPNQTTTQTQLLELGVQDRVGPDFEYRVSDKFVHSSQRLDLAAGSSEEDRTLHRPSLDLIASSGTLRWTQLFQSQEDRSWIDNGQDNRLVRNDVLEKLEWTPVDLPQVTGWFNYRTTEDRYFVDQERLDARLGVSQTLDVFSYEYSFRGERTDDLGVDVQSDRIEQLARLSYQDRHFQDTLFTTVSLFGSLRSNDTDVPAGSTPTLQVFPTQAFADIDTTPQVSTLPQNPALIDGNLAGPTGIDIGGFASGGQLSWNLAVQLPPGQSVDRVEWVTQSAVPANLAGQFAFSVWVSDDNAFWTLIQNSAAYTYDFAFQRFRISIPSVSNRFVKVVNTASPAAAPAVLVTEMEVFRLSAGGGSSRNSFDDSIRSATANVSWRLVESLTLGADLFVQEADATSNSLDTRDETRVDTGLWAAWTPDEQVDLNLRVSDQRLSDPLLRDEELLTLLGAVSYRPLRTLDFDLSLLRSDRDVDSSNDVQNDIAQTLASAELLPTLRAELGLEYNNTHDSTNRREIERWISSAGLIAEVTPTLDATLRARNDAAEVTGAGAAGVPDPSEERYELTLVWRPSEHLIGEAELRWIDSFAGEGLDERLRVDWIPFGDGTLDTQLDYDRTRVQSFGDSHVDRWRALVRYGLNPYAYLELQFAAEDPSPGDSTQILSVAFNYSS
ncbi:MAG: hypothetical protein IPK67_11785 [Planctomycetes bacterium]|nr:hypothetical protein [Planctomycetota bacterium]